MTRAKRIVLWSVGVLLALGIVAVSVGYWWLSSWYQIEQADPSRAAAAFDQIRARFTGVHPAFEIRRDRLIVVRAPGAPSSPTPSAVHILTWDPDRHTLSRVTLPFSISMVATEPLPLEALAGIADKGLAGLTEASRRGQELNVRLSDLERYGATLLLDAVTVDGKHLLMWNE